MMAIANNDIQLPPVETMFQAIAENVADIVLLTTPDNTYRWASPSVKRILGWDPKQFEGRRLADFVTPETYARVDYLVHTRSTVLQQFPPLNTKRPTGVISG